MTYLNDKAKTYVEPLARELDAPILLPLDIRTPGQMEAVFGRIAKDWGALDFCRSLHRLLAQGRAAGTGGRRAAGGIRDDDGGFLLVVHSHGAPGGAADGTAFPREVLHALQVMQQPGRLML